MQVREQVCISRHWYLIEMTRRRDCHHFCFEITPHFQKKEHHVHVTLCNSFMDIHICSLLYRAEIV